MDGLFELLVILAIVLFPVLETISKRKKRDGSTPDAEDERPRRSRRPVPGIDVEPHAGERSGRGSAEGDRSAEVLLPEDLWEELTGTAGSGRAESRTEGAAAPSDAPADAPAPAETHAPAPRPEPGPAPWRDPEPAEEPPGAAKLGGRMSDDRRLGDYTPETPPVEPPEVSEPRRADVLDEIGAAGAGALGMRRRRASELQRVRTGRLGRRGVSRRRARRPHPLLGELDRDELRRAVLFREILGPPLALRGTGGAEPDPDPS